MWRILSGPGYNRLLKNKHQAVSQGTRRFGKPSIFTICEHLQKPCNAGPRLEALFFNNLFMHSFTQLAWPGQSKF
jgi:hypothetical protein